MSSPGRTTQGAPPARSALLSVFIIASTSTAQKERLFLFLTRSVACRWNTAQYGRNRYGHGFHAPLRFRRWCASLWCGASCSPLRRFLSSHTLCRLLCDLALRWLANCLRGLLGRFRLLYGLRSALGAFLGFLCTLLRGHASPSCRGSLRYVYGHVRHVSTLIVELHKYRWPSFGTPRERRP